MFPLPSSSYSGKSGIRFSRKENARQAALTVIPEAQPFGVCQLAVRELICGKRIDRRLPCFYESNDISCLFLRCLLNQPRFQTGELCTVFRVKVSEQWVFGESVLITGVVEESHELVIVLMEDRIIRMSVALHTGKRSAHQHFPGGVYPVDDSGNPELFIVSAPFIVRHGIAMKSSCDILRIGRFRKQITGDLLNEELVIWHVIIKCSDEPVPVLPDVSNIIPLVSFGISVSSQV